MKTLFDKPLATARKTDPDSSHQAADGVESEGIASKQRRWCYNAVKNYPNNTARELAKYAELDRYMLSRRLPELEQLGYVRRSHQRRCTVGGRMSLTWESVK